MAAKPFGRFALCGMISQYNNTDLGEGVRGLVMAVGKSLKLQGFIVSNHQDMQGAFLKDLSAWVAAGKIEEQAVIAAVHDFAFQGGTLGIAAGEAIVSGMLEAITRRAPFVIFTASGGARMQEGMFSLMQMARTTVAVQRLRAAKLPYIVVLTNPTTGGVTASYAMLGDIQIAEPGAVVGFAGARVIEQTVRERLPEGFQRAEFLQAHGMVDMVVPRTEMRGTLARLCKMLAKTPREAAAA